MTKAMFNNTVPSVYSKFGETTAFRNIHALKLNLNFDTENGRRYTS